VYASHKKSVVRGGGQIEGVRKREAEESVST
jgi:hypothetical protein